MAGALRQVRAYEGLNRSSRAPSADSGLAGELRAFSVPDLRILSNDGRVSQQGDKDDLSIYETRFYIAPG